LGKPAGSDNYSRTGDMAVAGKQKRIRLRFTEGKCGYFRNEARCKTGEYFEELRQCENNGAKKAE
jgi:hypothetical protein